MALADNTLAAVTYGIGNVANWAQALVKDTAIAAANIRILDYQQDRYQDLSDERIAIIDSATGSYFERINELLPYFDEAYPDVPQAAEYVPVDPCEVQGDTIECNINHTKDAGFWARVTSRLQAQSDFARAVVLDPRIWVNLDMYALTLGDLLKGELPLGDVMEEMTDTAEAALLTGRIGAGPHIMRRNLNTRRLRAQHEGRAELRRQAQLMEGISPNKRQASPAEMMQTPQQRIALALTQGQLVQNDLQNLFNRQAEKPPVKLATLNLKLENAINRLQFEASKANFVNTFVPDYASILQPAINALSSTVTGTADPYSPMSSYNSLSTGGDWLEQNGGSNPFADTNLTAGHRASDRPAVF